VYDNKKIKKNSFDDDKKNKKIKKRRRRTPCSRQPAAKSPRTKSPTAAGMREHNRSTKSKKSIRSSIEQKEVK
jgi:hypothetical protein